MKTIASSLLPLLLLVLPDATNAQFTCTIGAQDESSCVKTKGDDSQHCAWCSLSGFGFCVSETQAETFEQSMPGVECDRYEGDDDAAQTDDDAEPVPDDNTMPAPTDDSVPDDFWTCLQGKDEVGCAKDAGCAWCMNKAGLGLCMSGPTAESAKNSDWFTCSTRAVDSATMEDPYDPACIAAFLANQTEESCEAAIDSEGNPCEWCSMAGMAEVCLTKEQAAAGAELGITCDDKTAAMERKERVKQGSFDAACIMAFFQNPTQDGCITTLDSDGNPCEWCSSPGTGNMCLNAVQADAGAALGIVCMPPPTGVAVEIIEHKIQANPNDSACIMAYLQDPTADGCAQTADEDGEACEYCSYAGVGNLCLTSSQADMASSLGVTCETTNAVIVADDPTDTYCIMAFMQNQSEQGCTTAVDEDGNSCEWCTYQGVGNLCLTSAQADMASSLGVTCEKELGNQDEDKIEVFQDPYDATCAIAFFKDMSEHTCLNTVDEDGQSCHYCVMDAALTLCFSQQQADTAAALGFTCSADDAEPAMAARVAEDVYDKTCITAFITGQGTQDECTQALDEDGNVCKWCHLSGVADVCLTATQGDMASQLGVWCDGTRGVTVEEEVDLPDDFFECLEHYQEHDCNHSSCTWCNSEVGMGFCMSPAAVDALKECTFFDCDSNKEPLKTAKKVLDPYDPICLTAGMSSQDEAEDVCNSTMDSNGSPCVWCDAAGVFGVCLSSEQASAAGQFLICDSGAFKIA